MYYYYYAEMLYICIVLFVIAYYISCMEISPSTKGKEGSKYNISHHNFTYNPSKKEKDQFQPHPFSIFFFFFGTYVQKMEIFLVRKERKKSESISFAQSKGSNYNRREEDPNLKYFQSIFACSDNSLNIYI